MTTATMLRRPNTQPTFSDWARAAISAFVAKMGDIFSRKGSTEPKSESWRYFSA